MTVFTASRLEAVELEDGLTLWGAADSAPAGTPGFLKGFSVDRGGTNVALFHGSERGGLPFQEEGKEPHAPFSVEEIGQAHAGPNRLVDSECRRQSLSTSFREGRAADR